MMGLQFAGASAGPECVDDLFDSALCGLGSCSRSDCIDDFGIRRYFGDLNI